MSDPITRDDLLALRDEYDRKLGALQAEVTTLRRRARRRGHPLLLLLPVVLLVAFVPFSLAAAAPVFSDLGSAAPVHQPDIQTIGDLGITTGFEDPNDPNARLYNPTDLVTRQEMASFLARTARLVRTARSNPGPYTRDTNEFTITKVLNIDTTFDPIVTVSITAPTAGFVIISSTVGVSIEGTGTVSLVRLRDAASPTGPASPTLTAATNSGPAATTAVATTLSPTYVFPVAAAQRSFTLEAQKSGPGTVKAYDGVITAIFVPFGSSGARVLEGE